MPKVVRHRVNYERTTPYPRNWYGYARQSMDTLARNYVKNKAKGYINQAVSTGQRWLTGSVPQKFVGPPRPIPRTPQKGEKGRKLKWGHSRARYAGRVKNGRRLSKKIGVKTRSMRDGFHLTKEYYGTIADPHIGYIIHNTLDMDIMTEAYTGAVIRKLFVKGGIDLEVRTNTLGLISHDNAGTNLYLLSAVIVDQSSLSSNEIFYDVQTNDSINDIVETWTAFKNIVKGYLADEDVYRNMPTELNLILRADVTGNAETRRNIAKIILTNEHISFVCKSTLRVQNRTKGDGTDDAELRESTDRVDSVPISGKVYTFKTANPRLKALNYSDFDHNYYLNSITLKGIMPIRGAEIPDYEEPPNPRHFANIQRVNNILIQPGDIKQMSIQHVYKGRQQALFDRLKAKYHSTFVTPATVVAGMPGKSQMVALEEMIRSITSNDINITYERQIEIGCFLTTRKKRVEFTTSLKSESLPNLGPP